MGGRSGRKRESRWFRMRKQADHIAALRSNTACQILAGSEKSLKRGAMSSG
jgi:hypothetical protein